MISTSSLGGKWRKPFLHGQYPAEFGRECWSDGLDEERTSPRYAYMNYVAHGACHWLVNFALRLAMLAEPDREWRIITSEYHSSVWDGRNTLFEFNWQAFGEPPEDCFHAAYREGAAPREVHGGGLCALSRDRRTEVTETNVQQDGATRILTERGYRLTIDLPHIAAGRTRVAVSAPFWLAATYPLARQPNAVLGPYPSQDNPHTKGDALQCTTSTCRSTSLSSWHSAGAFPRFVGASVDLVTHQRDHSTHA